MYNLKYFSAAMLKSNIQKTFGTKKLHEVKSGLRIMLSSCQLEKKIVVNLIIIIIIMLNSLQRYDIAQNYRILHRVVQRLPQYNLKILHHCHIQKLHQRK
jgi:hypothetical protein